MPTTVLPADALAQQQEIKTFEPQDGPQTDFMQTDADIAIYGGSAGG